MKCLLKVENELNKASCKESLLYKNILVLAVATHQNCNDGN